MKTILSMSIFMMFFATTAFSQNLTNVANAGKGGSDLMGTFADSDIDYDTEGLSDTTIERTIFAVSLAKPGESFDFISQFGIITEADPEAGEDGSGIIVGGGLRKIIFEKNEVHVTGHGLLNFLWEDYDDFTVRVIELQGGATLSWAANEQFKPFIGLEVTPFSSGKLKGDGFSSDFDRDDKVGLRLGTDLHLDDLKFQLAFTMMAEETFALSFVTEI